MIAYQTASNDGCEENVDDDDDDDDDGDDDGDGDGDGDSDGDGDGGGDGDDNDCICNDLLLQHLVQVLRAGEWELLQPERRFRL